jgi:hypothetical protein
VWDCVIMRGSYRGLMQNKSSVIDIVSSNKVTTEDALKIIGSLSAKQVLETLSGGHNILHILAADPKVHSSNLDIERVVQAIVAKNPAVLNTRLEILFTNPITTQIESIAGDTPFDMAIRQDNLALVKVLAPHYKDRENVKIFDFRKNNGEQIREHVSPLAFCLRHGQFEMFNYFIENGFGPLQSLEDLSKYNLANPTPENLQEFYKDLFVAGNKELLKELHRKLGYYEGHNSKNSKELIAALEAWRALYL